jgi:hypothetical protein
MNCVAQHELHLVRSSIARGLAYTDIAPTITRARLVRSAPPARQRRPAFGRALP